MSKYTIASVCNFEIANEYKPTIIPAYYTIPQADESELGILVVDNAFCLEYLGDDRTIRRDILAKELAESIVNDYCIAQLCTQNGGRPGIFAVEGEHDSTDIKKNFKSELKDAKAKHMQWAKDLVMMADDLWSVKKQHRQITNSMRHAARYLALGREWIEINLAGEATSCPACKKNLPDDAIVCFNCKCIINKEKYTELNFASA